MRSLQLTGSAVLAIAAVLCSTHVANAQTPPLDCAHVLNLPGDERPFALILQTTANSIEPDRAEAACRGAVRADPVSASVKFQLARALTLANKPLEAIKYYLDASDRGHTGAMNDLGGVFEYGMGVPKNLSTAIEWYERAAGLGHTGAMNHLGELNEKGAAIPQDLAAAARWYEKAATLGNPGAMNALADLLKQAGDLPGAVNWYREAARHGRASAMNSLGELSEAGIGVPQDHRSAREWYGKAAALGHADAMGNLGALLEAGRGGPPNLDAATEWYVKGAARNSRIAMHHLGAMLESGHGTAKSLSDAVIWYERAAALGYAPALNALGRLHLRGAGVAKNYFRAKSLFEQAAALGDPEAMNNLGMLYLEGKGAQRDIKLARTWLERAISLNNPDAQENLKRLDQAGLTDGTQIAGRRASCVETCATLHLTYVKSVCDRYPSAATEEKAERTKCIEMSLSLARQCRDTCREWAPTLSADNKCLACFRPLIACSVREESRYDPDESPYPVHSKTCLESHADCMANCGGKQPHGKFPLDRMVSCSLLFPGMRSRHGTTT